MGQVIRRRNLFQLLPPLPHDCSIFSLGAEFGLCNSQASQRHFSARAELLLCGLTHQLCPEGLINHNSCLSSPAPPILQIFLSFLILFVIVGLCLLKYSFIVICVQHAMFSQKSFLPFPVCKVF